MINIAILLISMAIDANILIFERTKEEIKRFVKNYGSEEGFNGLVRQSEILTLPRLSLIILYYSTTSFVRGRFNALIGVLISMFSAIGITRTMLSVYKNKLWISLNIINIFFYFHHFNFNQYYYYRYFRFLVLH